MAALGRLSATLRDIDSNSFADEDERLFAEDMLLGALARVQSPWDIAWNHNFVNATTHGAIKSLIDAGVFTKWAENGSKPETSTSLAKMTDTDPILIKRLVRHLASHNLLVETEEDTYEPSPWAKTLGTDQAFPSIYGAFYSDIISVMSNGLPSFLKETGFKNPTDSKHGVIQHLQGPYESVFEYIVADPTRSKDFSCAMECHSRWNMTAWTDAYPTDILLKDAKLDRPLVVDVGGNKGHDLEKFWLKHPEIPDGSLVIEDLPGILSEVEITNKAILKQPYDFFTPQPLRGARAYLVHKVLHDWSDEPAIKILKNIAGGMEKGYSKLLIHENLVETVRPSRRTTASDMIMLTYTTAAERTETEWHKLVNAAGLKIVKIWKQPTALDGVIEVDLA
ncbi:S-adenosyl-L-methionine-dependent methyltransferase [Daldinia vernicosa]|uniref:S-adenosyl-L-methionine-dependent methyltransferase n=1 Tax=Daldinia vernicosa TaxID=114800 RepID=UPI002008B792|nr:S-adenosyl-L-methionine-dependent methyltransferase [Daldinia vernicosa]KAI0849900.1 S-adenosyl-L-methionine-dependent methyltransferase [Daldinia vernicosa]